MLVWIPPWQGVPLALSDAQILLEDAQAANQSASEALATLWPDMLQGPLYAEMSKIGGLLAVAAIGFCALDWLRHSLQGSGVLPPFEKLVWPIICVVLLSNNGQLLAQSTLGARGVLRQVNQGLLSSLVVDVDLQESIHARQKQERAAAVAQVARRTCEEQNRLGRKPSPKALDRNCQRAEQAAAEDFLDEEEPGWLGDALLTAAKTLFYASHYAFAWSVEIALLLVSLFGPLAVGASLYPATQRPIFGWLSALGGIALGSLCFNITTGVASYIVVASNTFDMLFSVLLLGIAAPLISSFVVTGGSLYIFSTLSSGVIYSGVRGAIRASSGAGRGSFRASVKGAKALGKMLRR